MEKEITRKKFLWLSLVGLGGILSAIVGIPVVGFVLSPLFSKKTVKWVPVAWLEDLKSEGPKEVNYSSFRQDAWLRVNDKRTVYVMKQVDGNFKVLSTVCSHLGCSVHWDDNQQKFLCPCHGGIYDIQGKVLAGPPPRPLQVLETKIENDRLFVKET